MTLRQNGHGKINSSARKFLSLEEARQKRFGYIRDRYIKPRLTGIKEFKDFNLDQVIQYIDWTPFFRGWGLKGKYPVIFEKERMGPEAKRLFKEANHMLDIIKAENLVNPKGVIGLFPANSRGDDILIFKDEQREKVSMRIPMLRQQQARKSNAYTLSLADFVAPVNSGIKDHFGCFAVTTGSGIERFVNELKDNGDSYNSIMCRLIADRLVEASAELMHEWVRKKYWGYDPAENLSKEERLQGKYKGIRPAVGYPACPDHCIEKQLFELLQVEKRIGVVLNESFAMQPASSITGFYLSHNASRYFGIGKIGKDQLYDYAKRTGQSVKSVEQRLYFALDNNR